MEEKAFKVISNNVVMLRKQKENVPVKVEKD
jgi:hypothetical protein